MTVTILVATPHAPFGELLRMSLEDSGQYRVRLVLSGHEARAAAGRVAFQLAIIDSALTDEPFVPLCKDLLNDQNRMRLIVLPPDNNPNHPALGDLLPHGYLSRPFYLPDLISTVARLLNDRESELRQSGSLPAAAALSVTLPPWLQEPLTLNNYLGKELAGTQALAGMIGAAGVQTGRGQLRASAGQLSDEAAEELTGVVFRYWKRDEKTDLMRFIRLTADKRDYLVYATPITGDLVLILAYDTGAPLSLIRPQTKDLAQTLASLPPDGYHQSHAAKPPAQAAPPTPVEPAASAESPLPAEAAAPQGAVQPSVRLAVPSAAVDEPHTQPVENAFQSERPRTGHYPVDSLDPFEEDPGPELDIINLAALLGAIPSPDPEEHAPGKNGWHNRSASAAIPTLPGGQNGWDHSEAPETDRGLPPAGGYSPTGENTSGMEILSIPDAAREQATEQPPAPPEEAASPAADWAYAWAEPEAVEQPEAVEAAADQKSAEHPSIQDSAAGGAAQAPVPPAEKMAPQNSDLTGGFSLNPRALDLDLSGEPSIDPLEDTRPRVISTIAQLDQLEPVSPAISMLNYTCVLVPRLPSHYLIGELADRLSGWVAQICLAFGWRLEGIAVRPEYLQWSVQVAPAVSPGNVVRILRQRTSLHIFSAFAQYTAQNPSGDFWATGYLIVSGPQPPSAQLLRDYIVQTRKRQGIAK